MSVTVNGTNGLTFNDGSSQQTAASGFGFKNRIINGDMRIDQRNAGAYVVVPAANSNFYTLDRWACYVSGSSSSDVQRVPHSSSIPYVLQFNGSSGVTSAQIFQRIEADNIADAAGSQVTLSAMISNTLLTSATWAIFYANSKNSFSSETVIASGTFTGVSSTLTKFSTTVTLPAGAANGIEIQIGVLAQTSGQFKIGNVQLEKGSTATSFDYRPYGTELALCQRYLPAWVCNGVAYLGITFPYSTTNTGNVVFTTPVQTRVPATGVTVSAASQFAIGDGDTGSQLSALTFSTSTVNSIGLSWSTVGVSGGSRTAFRPHTFYNNTSGAYILGTGCEL